MRNPIRFLIADFKARRDVRNLLSAPTARTLNWDSLWKRGLEHLAVQGDVTDPYAQVGAVYTAISILSQSLASTPLTLFKGEDRIEEHPFYDLLAGEGSEELAGNQLMEGTVAWRETQGQAFWYLNGEKGIGKKRGPAEISLLEPERMKPICPKGELLGWKYSKAGGGTETFDVEEIVRFAYFDHRKKFGGLAPLEAARLSYRLNWRSSKFQDQFYTNGGFPPFYIKLPEGPSGVMTPEEQNNLRTEFREKYLGMKNAWVPPILARGATLETIGINQKDAEWLMTQKATVWDILNIFQVPPGIAGYTEDANRSVSVEERRKFWTGRIHNMGEHFVTIMQKRIIDVFWPGLKLKYDWKKKYAEVMPEETRASVETANKLWNMGVPASEAFDIVGLEVDVKDKPWLDEGFIPFSMTPASQAIEEPDEEPEDEDPEAEPFPEEDPEDDTEDPIPPKKKANAWPQAQKIRLRLWQVRKVRLEKLERQMLGDYRSFLGWLQREVTGELRSGNLMAETGLANIDALLRAGPKFPSAAEVHRQVLARTKGTLVNSLKSGWELLVEEVSGETDFDLNDPRVAELLNQRTQEIKNASDTEVRRLHKAIEEGLKKGETPGELAARVAKQIREAYNGQARVVARTEPAAAFAGAREEAMKAEGVEEHEWLSAGDERTREGHQIDGEVRKIGEKFSNGLTRPHDPSGSPENVIQCRCDTLPILR